MTITINVHDEDEVRASALEATGYGRFIVLRIGDLNLILPGFGQEGLKKAIEISDAMAVAALELAQATKAEQVEP